MEYSKEKLKSSGDKASRVTRKVFMGLKERG
jgi:hypothetical protein